MDEKIDLTDGALNPVTHFKSPLGGDLQACFEVANSGHLAFRAYQRMQTAGLAKKTVRGLIGPELIDRMKRWKNHFLS
jgi:hypothetical protein